MRNVLIILLWALLLIAGFFAYYTYQQKKASDQALDASRSQLAELEGQTADYNQKLSDASEKINQLEAASRELEADLQAAKVTGEESEARLQGLLTEIERLNAALAEKENEISELAKQYSEKEAASAETLSQKNRLFSDLQSAHKGLAAQVDEAGETIKQLQANEKDLQSKLDAERAAVKAGQAKLDGFHRSESYLKTQLAAALKSYNQLDADKKKLEQQIEEARRKISSLESQLADKTAALANLTSEKDSVLNQAERIKTTYEALVSGLREDIDKKQATIEAFEDKVRVRFVDRVLFKSGHSSVTAKGRVSLKNVAEALADMKGYTIRVSGHTDNIPIARDYRDRFPTNWELSSARAAAVVRYFVEELGWDGSRLQAIGHSYFQPVAENDTKEGRALNRRVEISVIPN